MNSNKITRRMCIVFVTLQIFFGVLIVRLFLIQLLHGEALRERSAAQRVEQEEQKVKRGQIRDRHGRVLAINGDLISVYADPKFMISSPEGVARKLAPLLNKPESEIASILHKKDRKFVWLKRNLQYSALRKIYPLTNSIRGLGYQIHGKRFYPKGELACHVIGNTNFENEGIQGIERRYNTYLLNKNSEQLHLKPKFSEAVQGNGKKQSTRSIALQGIDESVNADGNSVILTIDEYIQHLTEQALIAGCKEWDAKSGVAVVMESQTGEILAMANYPDYDLNHYAKSAERSKRNLAIWMWYEPGSVFKIIPAAAAVNEGVATPESVEDCELGAYRVPNGPLIHDIKPNGWLTLSQILRKSSNIGITKIATRLGQERLDKYTYKFGFGQKTGIDLPYERIGSLYALKHWNEYSLGSIPFGQGISVTPIQMLSAMNTIAADGLLMRPYVTRQIAYRDGQPIKQFHPIAVRRVISEETAEQMTQMLVGAASLSVKEKIENAEEKEYPIAGKTGTAQKAEKGKGYVDGKVMTTFVGFLPADKPQVSIIVVIDEPRGAPYSSKVTVPIFKQIAEETIRYLNQHTVFAQRFTSPISAR
jgi:cell division protein FtsI (penicillin-binding protein 3)